MTSYSCDISFLQLLRYIKTVIYCTNILSTKMVNCKSIHYKTILNDVITLWSGTQLNLSREFSNFKNCISLSVITPIEKTPTDN